MEVKAAVTEYQWLVLLLTKEDGAWGLVLGKAAIGSFVQNNDDMWFFVEWFLDKNQEGHKSKGKNKGKLELLNLHSSIKYDQPTENRQNGALVI